jgi:voltage-gated potassium channel
LIKLEVDAASALVGRKLHETNIRSELDIVIVSIRRSDGEILFNPGGDATIRASDMLIAIGKAESVMKLNALAKAQVIQGVSAPTRDRALSTR